MHEREAGEILESEFEKAVNALSENQRLGCTYSVHRHNQVPVPAAISEMNASNNQGVRTMVRFLSDALSGEAVTMVTPIMVKSPQGEKWDALVGAVLWREADNVTSEKLRAVQVVRGEDGKISETKPFWPTGIEKFVLNIMDGVISPVKPDAHSIAFARNRLEVNGFPPEVIGSSEGLDNIHKLTVH